MKSQLLASTMAFVALVAACGGDARPPATTILSLEQEFGWEDCEAPLLEDHRVMADLMVPWAGPDLELEPVAEIPQAIEVAALGSDLYVTTQEGEFFRVAADGTETRILDLRRRVSVGEERGLLGVVFSPDGGHAYLSFTDRDGTVIIEEYAMPDWSGRRQVLALEQPERWHNGGHMAFGPDGMFYAGFGDGGDIGDPDRLAQDRNNLYGTIIRIDVSTGDPYAIPDDNPFADGRAEIIAYGLRNPWQFSFDSETGDLWLGDVGQNCWEEIDRIPPGEFGQNFGWSRVEGPMRFRNDIPGDYTPPVLSYDHQRTCAISGGRVYRGEAVPELDGLYVFADYCRGRLLALETDGNGEAVAVSELGPHLPLIVSFSVDGDGELLVVSKDAGVFRLSPG